VATIQSLASNAAVWWYCKYHQTAALRQQQSNATATQTTMCEQLKRNTKLEINMHHLHGAMQYRQAP